MYVGFLILINVEIWCHLYLFLIDMESSYTYLFELDRHIILVPKRQFVLLHVQCCSRTLGFCCPSCSRLLFCPYVKTKIEIRWFQLPFCNFDHDFPIAVCKVTAWLLLAGLETKTVRKQNVAQRLTESAGILLVLELCRNLLHTYLA